MMDKFDNLISELDDLVSKTRKVKTRKQARDLSLKKWRKIQTMAGIFFNEFWFRCGFCGYGEQKAQKKTRADAAFVSRCACCGVKTICDMMTGKSLDLQEKTMDLIDELITHFENMKVADG